MAFAICGTLASPCQFGKQTPCPGVVSGRGVKSPGVEALLHSFVRPQFPPDRKLRTAVIRLTVDADGRVLKAELVRSSRVKSWDKEIMEKVQRAKFPEATKCGGLVFEVSIWPDLLN